MKLAVTLLALAVVVPTIAQSAETADPDRGRARSLVIATSDDSSREVVRVIEEIEERAFVQAVDVVFEETADAFRAAVRAADVHVLVLVGHGEPAGLRVGGSLVPWDALAADIERSDALAVVLLACHSTGIGNVRGTEVLLAYDGLVDLEVAALDGAYHLATRTLSGAALASFADAHSAHVNENGGALRFVALLVSPVRPLQAYDPAQSCVRAWRDWRSPYPAPGALAHYANCSPMTLEQDNHGCAWADVHCSMTVQEQRNLEKEMETASSVEARFGWSKDYMNGLLSVGLDVNVDGVEHELYVSFGNAIQDDKGRVLHDGKRSGTCARIVDLANFAVPGVEAMEKAVSSLPGVKANVEGLTLLVCASVQGGIARDDGRDVTSGTLEGRVDFRAVSGIHLEIRLWWIRTTTMAEMTASYPLAVEMDLKHRKPDAAVDLGISLGAGPLEIQIQENLFDTYLAVQIPLLTRKTDIWKYTWRYGDGAAPAANRPLDLPGLGHLPPGWVLTAAPDAVVQPLEAGTALPVAEILELRRGDAYLNHLVRTGALERLGVDPSRIGGGESVFLDLAHPHVVTALALDADHHPRHLVGLPGGWTVAGSTCPTLAAGTFAALFVEDCDPSRPVLGLGSAFSQDPGVQEVLRAVLADGSEPPPDDVRPTSIGKAVVPAGVEYGSSTARVVCIGTPAPASPLSGRSYSVAELCDWLAHDASAGEGWVLVEEAADGHRAKVLLERLGVFAWLTSPCSLAAVPVDRVDRNLCLTLRKADVPEAEPPMALRVPEVAAQFEEGVDRVMMLAHGGAFGSEETLWNAHFGPWSEEEPLTTAGGKELEGVGLQPLLRLVHETECDVWAAAGQRPPACR